MSKIKLGAVLAVFVATSAPAFAASTVTDLFMANVKANAAFLDQSGKLAATHTTSDSVRSFAKTEVADAFRMAEMIDGVAPSTQVADASPGSDTVVTGRSAATAAPLAQAANGRAALGKSDVTDLAQLHGRNFDDALWLKQIDALSQLRADYETYAAHGDDAVLVAVAKRELPVVEQRLLALSRI